LSPHREGFYGPRSTLGLRHRSVSSGATADLVFDGRCPAGSR
jgi:hypothetical protein